MFYVRLISVLSFLGLLIAGRLLSDYLSIFLEKNIDIGDFLRELMLIFIYIIFLVLSVNAYRYIFFKELIFDRSFLKGVNLQYMVFLCVGSMALSFSIHSLTKEIYFNGMGFNFDSISLHTSILLFEFVLIQPFLEEYSVRWVFYSTLKSEGFSVVACIVISSLVWVILHFNFHFFRMISLFVFGVFLGVVRFYFRGLFAPFFCHLIFNAMAVCFVFF